MTLETLFGLIAMMQSVTSSLDLYDVPVPSFCDSLGCANNSTCRTTLTNNEIEGSHVTYSECLCYGHWIGQKCDHHLSLTLLRNHDNSATLQTDVKFHDLTSREVLQDASQTFDLGDLNFNVQYWSKEIGAMCSIMTQVKNKHFQINGLKDGKEYAVCVSSVGVDLCFAEDRTEFNLQTNCVLFRTLHKNETSPTSIESKNSSSNVAGPVSLSVFFFIVFILLIVTIVKCRKERYYEDIVPTFRYWVYSFRHNNCPCLSNDPPPQTIVPSQHGCMFPRSGNSRYRNYNNVESGNVHPTSVPLTTIEEHTNEDAETSASPLMDTSQSNDKGDNP